MTKRRYRNSPRVSRAGGPPKSDLPTDRHQPDRRRRPSGRRPFGYHYEGLQPESESHPIDLIVDRAPELVALRPKLRRMLEAVKLNSSDLKLFIAYEDTRSAQAAAREALFFDAGYEYGQTTGRAESVATSGSASPAGRELVRRVYLAALNVGLPGPGTAAVLLQLARAFVVGLQLLPPKRRSRRRPHAAA